MKCGQYTLANTVCCQTFVCLPVYKAQRIPQSGIHLLFTHTFRPDATGLLASGKPPPNLAQTQEPSLRKPLCSPCSPKEPRLHNHSPSSARSPVSLARQSRAPALLRTPGPRPLRQAATSSPRVGNMVKESSGLSLNLWPPWACFPPPETEAAVT